ncbi:MAG: hypothetical protein WBG18_11935 [Xanthobacteraceae bacterium]
MADEKKVWGMRSKLMAHGDERFSMFLRESSSRHSDNGSVDIAAFISIMSSSVMKAAISAC